jgi:hypothetical protein
MEREKVEMMQRQPTWFFKRQNGEVFAVNEKEAYEILVKRRRDVDMVGQSDGAAYYKVISEAGPRTRELEEQIREKKAHLNKLIEGHDKLLFEDFASEDDPRLKRAKKAIEVAQKEMEPIEKEIKELKGGLIQKAWDAEYKAAEGNRKMPRDFSVIKKGADTAGQKAYLDNFAQSKRAI